MKSQFKSCKSDSWKKYLFRTQYSFLTLILLIFYQPTAAQVNTSIDTSDTAARIQTEQYLKRLIDQAEARSEMNPERFEEIEIDKIIVDEMISKAGDDFFDNYTSDFEWPESEQNFIIVISEKPFIANSTLVSIKVNDLEVFKNILQPRSSYLEELADYAQAITAQYIMNYQQILRDLDGEDRSGTGIY
jgi:curli production assembly/transport component CsgE